MEVNVQCNVVTRALNPDEHGLAVDSTALYQLTTSDTAYTSDTTAFSTTVYNYYNSQLSAANVSTVEIRWVVWTGGDATEGGTTTNDGVIGTITDAADLQAELEKHIAYALTGDQMTPGS